VQRHVAPGLGNAIGSIYTSFMSGTPMIVTAGQQEQGHGLTEPLLYAPLIPIATPVVKWAIEVRIQDLPRITPRRQGRDHGADRPGLHLPARRHSEQRQPSTWARVTRVDTAARRPIGA
jgi:benzoylformate decarboxylase